MPIVTEINNPVGYVYSNLQSLEGYLFDLFRLTDAVNCSTSLKELRLIKKNINYDYLRNDLKDILAESREGIERVKTIIFAMKDFCHIEEEEFKLADLHRGLEATLNVVNNELKYKAVVIRDFGVLPEIECNVSQINQVIMNLLVNAAQAIEELGVITVRTRHNDDEVVIEVEDTGKGILPEHFNQIFELFYNQTYRYGNWTGFIPLF
jgi:signal transduction histidine kinase